MFYLFLADGFEETEALAPLDMMRRAKIEVKTVGVTGEFVTGSHGVTVKADLKPEEISFNNIDGVVLPGGMPGTINLGKSETVTKAAVYCAENGKITAAICAAPSVLGNLGILKGKKATCFPGFEKELEGATYEFNNDYREEIEKAGMIITGTSPNGMLVEAVEIPANKFYIGRYDFWQYRRMVFLFNMRI